MSEEHVPALAGKPPVAPKRAVALESIREV